MTLHLETREQPFQNIVMSLLDMHGWRGFHAPDNRPVVSKRGKTYVQRVTPGFPDVVAARGIEVLVAELKTEKGRLSADQVAWLDEFRGFASSLEDLVGALPATEATAALVLPVFEVHVWRPSDLQAIEDRLSRPRRDA